MIQKKTYERAEPLVSVAMSVMGIAGLFGLWVRLGLNKDQTIQLYEYVTILVGIAAAHRTTVNRAQRKGRSVEIDVDTKDAAKKLEELRKDLERTGEEAKAKNVNLEVALEVKEK